MRRIDTGYLRAGNDLATGRVTLSLMPGPRAYRVFSFEVGGRSAYLEDDQARGLAEEILATLAYEDIQKHRS